MFYECRIYNAKGKLKKTISAKKLSKRHWENFKSKPLFSLGDGAASQLRKALFEKGLIDTPNVSDSE